MTHGTAIRAGTVAILVATAASAQPTAPFQAEYTVAIKDTAAHLFHVTASFSNLRQPRLDVSLPIWTPGWYTLEYYAKNMSRFAVTDGAGTRLPAPLSRAQTWSIDTRGRTRIVVEFDYLANVLALNQAKVTSTFAFFTGTQLFLEPIGHRDVPSIVRFVVPPGWRIVSALPETSDSAVFTAPDYDTLVDAPTWLGAFQLHRFSVDGTPHSLVLGTHAVFPADSIRRYTERFASMVRAASAIFGGLPYEKYLVFWLPGTPESPADGALEHGNSYVACCGGPTGLSVNRYTAHEFFHLWNVKRIRPAALWPYDYSRPVETPSLWVSEGVSDYYGLLITYRAGLLEEQDFLSRVASTMAANERNEERRYMSLSDASMATWRWYLHEPVSYYSTGFVLGALLDLSILRDTRGARGLDAVMRQLHDQFYRRNKGFTPEDLVRTVSAVAGRDYGDFFRRYVTGLEVPPYDSILGYAGIRTRESSQMTGLLNALATVVPQGRRVDTVLAGGTAATAGIRKGDILISVDGTPIQQVAFAFPNGCCLVKPLGDERVVIGLLRDSSRMEVTVTLRPYRNTTRITEYIPDASPEQHAVRRAWLARRTQ